jgi:hypothetical protein
MLRRPPDRYKGMEFAPFPDLCPSFYCDMGQEPRPLSERHVLAHDTKGADDHVVGQLCFGMDDGMRMNLH